MPEPVTIETIRAGRLRDAGHLNYGKRGGGTIWQHTTIPRLSAHDRPTLSKAETARHGATRIREWCVDGTPVGTIEAAVAALAVPPVLTDEEAAVLARVPADWVELHDFRTALGEEWGAPVGGALIMLRQKGMIENERRPGPPDDPRPQPWIRRTPAEAGEGAPCR